jgi:hypothetical protein
MSVDGKSKRVEELKSRLKSLKVQKEADEKSIERYRAQKNSEMVAELTRHIKATIDKEIIELETRLNEIDTPAL